jgi:UDP-N-acetylmuramoylalanine--D-glutamate ligase
VRKVAEPHPPDYLVVEVSSFQLERIHTFRPFIAAVLNITADHLDRYNSFEDYAEAKRRIAENQQAGDFLIVNENLEHLFPVRTRSSRIGNPMEGDFPTVLTFGQKPSAHLSLANGTILSRVSGHEKRYDAHSHWRLRGDHNLENAAVAIGVAEILGIPDERIASALSNFAAPHHRIEFVDRVRGVDFVDDSKATNVDAVVRALESFCQPVILIAGGRDKGGAYDPLKEVAREKVKLAVLIGEARERMYASLHDVLPSVFAADLDDAVELALQNAVRGDVVLLSPACSSFDMFKDYKHRGEVFQTKVKQLKHLFQERRRNHEAA